jgi:hypothetical protein
MKKKKRRYLLQFIAALLRSIKLLKDFDKETTTEPLVSASILTQPNTFSQFNPTLVLNFPLAISVMFSLLHNAQPFPSFFFLSNVFRLMDVLSFTLRTRMCDQKRLGTLCNQFYGKKIWSLTNQRFKPATNKNGSEDIIVQGPRNLRKGEKGGEDVGGRARGEEEIILAYYWLKNRATS